MLKELFASETIVAILTILFANPKKRFYLRQLSGLTGKYPRSVSGALRKLEEAEIVTSARVGNLKYFSLSKKSPIYSELKSMILKTTGVGNTLRETLGKLGGVEFAFIYGSAASGKEIATSDIDLMLIGKVDLDEANRLVARLEKRLGREVNLTVFDSREWEERKRRKEGFVKNVLAGRKIMLMGEEDEL